VDEVIKLDVIDFAKEQLLNDLAELENARKSKDYDDDRYKLKLAGILSNYDVKRETNEVFDSDIQEKISVFLSAKKIEGLSPKTLENYRLELNLFDKALIKNVSDITSNDIRLYLSRYDNLKMSTIRKKLWVLKSFFGWLHTEEVISRNPTAKVKPPKVESLMVKTFSIEELEMMRESCQTLRERTLVECLYSSGARLSELQQLNISDVDFQDKSSKVIGKGQKERIVYFSIKAIFYLRKYLRSRNDDCEALFITQRKPYRRITNRGIQREIRIISERAGISQNISPHWYRRSMATNMMEKGASLSAVQHILGHSSPNTTQLYCNVPEEMKKEQHRKYLPL